jgi:tetratricopeptide (TPR) repeat protein
MGAALLWQSLLCAQEPLSDQIRRAQSSGNYAAAAQLYGQLIRSGTDTPEVRSNYGIMLHLAGQNQAAVEQFRIALHGKPDLDAANLFAGLTLLDLEKPKEALPYLKRARELDPKRPVPVLGLGKAYVALRQYDSASECYQQAVALDNNSAEAWYGLGVTDRSRAEELLNHAARQGLAKNNPDKAQADQLLDSALKALTRAAELAPDSARTHLLMAEALASEGKFADALPEYQTTIRLDPTLTGAYLGLATEYWKQRQFDQALPLLQKVLARSPKDPEANGIMADITQHNGDNTAAKRYATVALSGNPDLIETHVVLARVYLATGQPTSAVQELKKAVAADPDGSYHFLLYRAYKQAGDEANARRTMAEFQQIRYSAPSQ